MRSTNISATILDRYAILRIPEEQQHFWSPEMTVSTEETEEGTILRGLIGPKPTVWTLFFSFYAFMAFIILIALIWGLSQWSLGHSPHVLWLVPIASLLWISAYAIALTGQKLSRTEMKRLISFLQEALHIKIDI